MIPLTKTSKILVVKPSSLGDVVHSLPFLSALNRRFRDAEIHWAVARGLEGLLEGHPMLTKLWVMDKDRWKKPSRTLSTLREMLSLARGLRAERFGLAVDLQGLLRSGLITAASGAAVRVGFAEAREGSRLFYTHRVRGGREVHAVDRYLRVAGYLGCDTGLVDFPVLADPYPVPVEEYAVLAAGARWETKKWPAEKFGELAARLPVQSVVAGGLADSSLAETIVSLSGGRAVSLAGKTTLRELAGVIKGARFMVSNDTGPMHIAAALGVPVFALFGPTSPARTGPYGHMHRIIGTDLPCAPCYKRYCKEPKCMEGITVEKVLSAINEWRPSGKP